MFSCAPFFSSRSWLVGISIPAAAGCAESPTKVGRKSKPPTMWLGTRRPRSSPKGELVRFGGSFKGEGDQRGGESMHCCVCDHGRPSCVVGCDGSRSDVFWNRKHAGLGKLSEEMCGLCAPSAPNLYGQHYQAAAVSGAKLWVRTFFGPSGILECCCCKLPPSPSCGWPELVSGATNVVSLASWLPVWTDSPLAMTSIRRSSTCWTAGRLRSATLVCMVTLAPASLQTVAVARSRGTPLLQSPSR